MLPEDRLLLRLVMAHLMCVLYLNLLYLAAPFKRKDDNALALAANLMLMLAFFSAIFIKIYDDVEATAMLLTSSSEKAAEVSRPMKDLVVKVGRPRNTYDAARKLHGDVEATAMLL